MTLFTAISAMGPCSCPSYDGTTRVRIVAQACLPPVALTLADRGLCWLQWRARRMLHPSEL